MPTKTRKQREEVVEALTKDLDGVDAVVLAEYAKVQTPVLNQIRNKLRPLKGQCRIVKNRLAKVAFKNRGIEGMDSYLNGQLALVLNRGDVAASIKVVVEANKENENWKIRAGYLNGQVFEAAEIKAIAALPPKPILLAQLLGSLQGPVSQLQGAFTGPLRYLANALDQVAKQKEAKK